MLRLLVHEANVPNWVFWRFAADIAGVRRASSSNPKSTVADSCSLNDDCLAPYQSW